MKREVWLEWVTAAVLSFAAAWGTVGCLTSAFELTQEAPRLTVLLCGLAGAIFSLLWSLKRGGSMILGLWTLGGFLLWRQGAFLPQLRQMLHRILALYDLAYGWGLPPLTENPWDNLGTDIPLVMLGAAVACLVSRSLCRRTGAVSGVLACLIPLMSCMVVTDTLPDGGYLLPVLAVAVLLILPASVRQEDPAQGLRLTAAAAVPVTAALALLLMVAPQENYVNQVEPVRQTILTGISRVPEKLEAGLEEMAVTMGTSASRRVSLDTLGDRRELNYPVMDIITDTQTPLYLREQGYEIYDGRQWTASGLGEMVFGATEGPAFQVTVKTRSLKENLFLPYCPAEAVVLTGGSAANEEKLMTYTRVWCGLPENWRQQTLSREEKQTPLELASCLLLPEETRKGAEEYLKDILGGTLTATEKADRIAACVTASAVYDTHVSTMPEEERDFALWFLREGQQGYCVHFATAAAVLLRAAEVPARYVTGYLVEPDSGSYVTVTEAQAHAWVEYYEPLLDRWIPLEATPAQAVTLVSPEDTTQPTAAPQTEPATEPVSLTHPPETAATGAPAESLPEASGPAAPEGTSHGRGRWLWLLLILPLAELQRLWRRWLRSRRLRRGDRNRRALLMWRQTEELSRLLGQVPPRCLLELAQRAKFSRQGIAEEDLEHFTHYNLQCRSKLKEKPWHQRMLYRYRYAL